jgi:hypothetical protein
VHLVPSAPGDKPAEDRLDQLQKLAALRDQGALTSAEFEAQKALVLAASNNTTKDR